MPYSLSAEEAGERFIQFYTSSDFGEKIDTSKEIAVALSTRALPRDFSDLRSFTHVDFIVSAQKYKPAIAHFGDGTTTDDVHAKYMREDDDILPYKALSIPFDSILHSKKVHLLGRSENTNNDRQDFDDYLINLIIGDENCYAATEDKCQNWALRSNYTYLYVLLFKHFCY